MKKPILAIAYYYNGENEKDAEVYVSLDNLSKEEFFEYFKSNYVHILKKDNIEGIYAIDNGFLFDVKGKRYKVKLERKVKNK
jgi:hypothetical protein